MIKTVYTLAEVQKIIAKEQRYGIKSAVEGILSAMGLELLDKQGMDVVKVGEILRGTLDTFDSISKGYLNLNDVRQTLKEEYDLDINLR